MSDVPPGGLPPPPPPGDYPPPGSYPPPGGYPPPPAPYPPSPYQQQGYGWSQGGPIAEFAGFWIRFAASLLDGIIVGIPVSLLAFLADPDQFRFNAGVGYNPTTPPIVNLIGTILGIAYYTLLEGGSTGQTLGKKALSIRVVDVDTLQPGIGNGRGAGRYLARILSSIPCGLGYFWMLWDPKKQTWHDKLVRTVVVKA